MPIHVIRCYKCKTYLYDSDREERVYCADCQQVFNESRERQAELREEGQKERDLIWKKYVEDPTRR